jgi:hypothetical protein
VLKDDPDWIMKPSESQGGTMVFFNQADAQSMALAKTIGDTFTIYRSPKRTRRNTKAWTFGFPMSRVLKDRADAIGQITSGDLTSCQKAAQRHIAYRDGDATARAAMDAEDEAERAAWIAGAGAMLGGRGCNRLEANDALASQHLSRAEAAGLAAKARALMVENDPDAIRTGLAEIADALDAISRQAA